MSIDLLLQIVVYALIFLGGGRLGFSYGRHVGRCEGVSVTMHLTKQFMREEIDKAKAAPKVPA